MHTQSQTDNLSNHPLCELLSLDKELRCIWGSLKVEVVKKAQLEKCIEREKHKLSKIKNNPEYDDGNMRKRIKGLND